MGTAGKGTLRETDAYALANVVVAAARARSGIDAADVEQVVLGETLYGGGDIARYTAIAAGMPAAAGIAVNSWCSSGLTAVTTAAAGIRSGMLSVAIAGGSNSSSTSPRVSYRTGADGEWDDHWLAPSHPDSIDAPNKELRRRGGGIGVTAMCAGGGMSTAVVLEVAG